jgi:aspartyl-tRNA(Asn)/glutamyl-tRNA(Gln) amidotransferase subunit A
VALPDDPARPYGAWMDRDVAGLRLAWAAAPGGLSVAPDVALRVAEARAAFEDLGCVVEAVEFDLGECAGIFAVLWACGRATAVDGLLPAQVAEFDPLLRALIDEAAALSGADVIRALGRRGTYATAVHAFFARFDALVCPTLPITAFEEGAIAPPHPAGWRSGDPDGRVKWLWWTPFTYPFNITGQPAISVPCGLDRAGLPVGLQIVGRRFDDARVLQLAAAFERARPWAELYPPTYGPRGVASG